MSPEIWKREKNDRKAKETTETFQPLQDLVKTTFGSFHILPTGFHPANLAFIS